MESRPDQRKVSPVEHSPDLFKQRSTSRRKKAQLLRLLNQQHAHLKDEITLNTAKTAEDAQKLQLMEKNLSQLIQALQDNDSSLVPAELSSVNLTAKNS